MEVARRLAGPSEKATLVRAIRDGATSLVETDWLEWKSTLDLGQVADQVEVARQILGFANRAPEQANRIAEGHAYLLVGVAEGQLAGIPRLDLAALENALIPWIGSGALAPRWDPQVLEVEGARLLLIEVAAPRSGDRLFPLRKEFNTGVKGQMTYAEGSIFIRSHGRTHRADAAEIDQLSERAAQRASRVGLTVDWWHRPEVRPIEVTGEQLDKYLDTEAQRLLAPLPDPLALTSVGYVVAVAGGETRSIPDYRRSVAAYLDELRARIHLRLRSHAVARGLGRAGLRFTNPSDENLQDVEVVVTASGAVGAYFFAAQAWAETKQPQPPLLWGTRKPLAMPGLTYPVRGLSSSARQRTYEATNDAEGFEIRVWGFDLRPHEIFAFRKFFCVLEAPASGVLRLNWRATAKNVSGLVEGTLEIAVGMPVPLADIFDRPVRTDLADMD
jgi:hypothetical protein